MTNQKDMKDMDNETIFSRMLEQADDINARYNPIYGVTVLVDGPGEDAVPFRARVTVTCDGEEVLRREVATLAEFDRAVTQGVGISLGVPDGDDLP